MPGQDEEAWLRLNASAFASHPEQGGWTSQDLALREEEPWFDPAGFFIADRDGTMAGFHWTKVPGIGAAQRADGPAGDDETRVGEVYVVGVDPGQRGTGLGRALTLAGLRHLRASGLEQAMLYVDEENVPAVKMYESLGFTRWRTDAMYADATPAAASGRLAALDPEYLVELRGRQRMVTRCDRAEHLRVEFNLVQGHSVVNTEIQLPWNRAHLRY